MTAEEVLANKFIDLGNTGDNNISSMLATYYFGQNDLDKILSCMQEYARIKCLEAIRNTRHTACEVATYNREDPSTIPRVIMNIDNKDVMPEL